MVRFIWSQLRRRAGRSLALLAGVLTATTGFTVLAAATETSRLTVTGTLSTARVTYDILVRPAGSRAALEQQRGLVRPNSLTGLYGGVSLAQYAAVGAIPGVEVAAPIAMVGYSIMVAAVPVDVTAQVDRSLERQVIRLDRRFRAERGLSEVDAGPDFVYVTRNPVVYVADPARPPPGDTPARYTDGFVLPADLASRCGLRYWAPPLEVFPDGSHVPLCNVVMVGASERAAGVTDASSSVGVAQLLPDGRFQQPGPYGRPAPPPTDRLVATQRWALPFMIAAIDPPAEARLTGIDRAVVAGRYLGSADAPPTGTGPAAPETRFPALATSRPYVDAELSVRASRISGDGVAGPDLNTVRDMLVQRRGTVLDTGTYRVDDAYRRSVQTAFESQQDSATSLDLVYRAGNPTYQELGDGALRVQPVAVPPKLYDIPRLLPWQANDTTFRPLSRSIGYVGAAGTGLLPVGMFDPERLAGGSELGRVPMETYQPPSATGGDERSRRLLGDRSLAPNGNPGGYLAAPPLMLVSLAALPRLFATSPDLALKQAPLSAIRVKVAGVDGYTRAGAERVRLVAEQITTATGLDVDITYGSSMGPQAVDVAAGAFGRPDLRLSEQWSRKGVAATITTAVDRKSLALFVLVLVVCVLFVANATAAAVRARRPELAVLACLGWPARRIGAVILGEVLTLGLLAGLASVAVAAPLGHLAGLRMTLSHAALAVPVALGVVLLAGMVPAVRAGRAHPAAALRPPGLRARRLRSVLGLAVANRSVLGRALAKRARRPRSILGLAAGNRSVLGRALAKRVRRLRSVLGLAVANLGRLPGRTLLGAAGLAIGVAALTVLTALTWVFHGAVVGTVLGDAVAIRVRGVDTSAVVATVLLGVTAVADVLYLNIRDRAGELAALSATGWSPAALGRLVTYEGLGIGALGAVLGAGTGLGIVAALTGGITGRLWATGLATAAAGVLLAAAAALVPALLTRRLPVARLLSEE